MTDSTDFSERERELIRLAARPVGLKTPNNRGWRATEAGAEIAKGLGQ